MITDVMTQVMIALTIYQLPENEDSANERQ
jgi:hypothetical protein